MRGGARSCRGPGGSGRRRGSSRTGAAPLSPSRAPDGRAPGRGAAHGRRPGRSAPPAPSIPCRGRAARPPRRRRPSAPARSPRTRAARTRTSARAAPRSRSAGGLGPTRLGEQLLHLAAREHLGQLAGAARRAQRGGGIRVEQAVAAQVAVEAAQAGALAVDRGRRRRARGPARRRSPRCRPRAARGSPTTSAGVASSADSSRSSRKRPYCNRSVRYASSVLRARPRSNSR